MALGGIQNIEYRPGTPYQLFLGTNGSGKSSFIYEISPLPASHFDYEKGGYKEVELTHDGHEYHLSSRFGSTNKHSFIKNGEERNHGGTASAQKELVLAEFGYNEEIHELLVGAELFTEMGLAERRSWITRLCETDVTDASRAYNKISAKSRNARGARANLRERLVYEKSRKLPDEALAQLRDEIDRLKESLSFYQSRRDPNIQHTLDQQSQYEFYETELTKLSCALLAKRKDRPDDFREIPELANAIQEADNLFVASRARQKAYEAEYGELEKVKREASLLGNQSVEEIEKRRSMLVDELSSIGAIPGSDDVVGEDMLSDLYLVKDSVFAILGMMPPNPDGKYTPTYVRLASENIQFLNKALQENKNEAAKISLTLENMKSLHAQTCPNCQHQWVPGYDQHKQQAMATRLQELDAAQKEQAVRILAAEEDHRQATKSCGFQNQLRELAVSYPRLRDFWVEIATHENYRLYPASVTSIWNEWVATIEKLVRFQTIQKELVKIDGVLEAHQKTMELGGSHYLDRIKYLGEQIELELDCQQRQNQVLKKLSETRDYRLDIERMTNDVLVMTNQFVEAGIAKAKYEIFLKINEAISKLQSQLAVQEANLTEQQTLSAIIDGLETNLSQVEDDEATCLLLMNMLSPVDGLIADTLTGFIECFVEEINEVIADVWAYPLNVVACGLESGDLNYKFPLRVSDVSEYTPDIKKASDGQKEIINLAFRLKAMAYLKLNGFPIYLDEFGAKFDEKHKQDTVNLIKKLIDCHHCSQLFMISHDQIYQTAFPHAEICVFDANNLTLNKNCNEHVRINQ